jgi:hypothetical protein
LKSFAAGLGFAAMAIAAPAQAISIQDLSNKGVITLKTHAAALVLSLSTEVFRSAQDRLAARAECIEKNFLPMHDASGFDAVLENIDRARDKTAEVGSYIERNIDGICSSGGGAQVPTSHAMEHETTSVQGFVAIVAPNNEDKVIILDVAISTQAERVKRAGNEARGQCIGSLQTEVVDSRPVPPFPAPFKQDIMQKLAAAYASGDSRASVESILEDAIIQHCGPEKPASKEPK